MPSNETAGTALDQIVSAPVTTDTRDWLNDEAKRQQRKRSEIIRFALDHYRAHREAQEAGAAA